MRGLQRSVRAVAVRATDGARVHDADGLACLMYGEKWRGAAVRALTEPAPSRLDP
jgi:hypothetical protein